jgi:ribosomal protein S21
MGVIVHANENIDSALKRLHREVLREKILETYRNKVYRIKKSQEEAQKRREWAKQKRRRSAARRRKENR